MVNRESAYRGCLLGMAAGDAMGYAVDGLSWEEIQRDYGPEGIRGYDLVNGYADVTSHTQLAAYCANGLLVGLTRGQMLGRMAPYVRYVDLAMREWSQGQHLRRLPDKTSFWVSEAEELRRRRCMDTRLLDTLSREKLGTMAVPLNSHDTPGALCAAAMAGVFFAPGRMEPHEVGSLGAETVALVSGDAMTFLSGAVAAYVLAGILQDPDTPLREHFLQAAEVVAGQFGREYPQAEDLKKLLHRALLLVSNKLLPAREAMEHLRCVTCAEVLAGAMYASLRSEDDFDAAMILAVNHSGRSAAVGAMTGAFLGAKRGVEILPEFYLEGLEPVPVLAELAEDLRQGCPLVFSTGFFDDTWDQKYIQGRRVDQTHWAEE